MASREGRRLAGRERSAVLAREEDRRLANKGEAPQFGEQRREGRSLAGRRKSCPRREGRSLASERGAPRIGEQRGRYTILARRECRSLASRGERRRRRIGEKGDGRRLASKGGNGRRLAGKEENGCRLASRGMRGPQIGRQCRIGKQYSDTRWTFDAEAQ